MQSNFYTVASIARFYSGEKRCNACKVPLVVGENQHPSWAKVSKYLCKPCGVDYARNLRQHNRERGITPKRRSHAKVHSPRDITNAYVEALNYGSTLASAPVVPVTPTHDLIETDAILQEPRVTVWMRFRQWLQRIFP